MQSFDMYRDIEELPTLLDSSKSSLKTNQSFHFPMNKIESFPDYGNFVHIMLYGGNFSLKYFVYAPEAHKYVEQWCFFFHCSLATSIFS